MNVVNTWICIIGYVRGLSIGIIVFAIKVRPTWNLHTPSNPVITFCVDILITLLTIIYSCKSTSIGVINSHHSVESPRVIWIDITVMANKVVSVLTCLNRSCDCGLIEWLIVLARSKATDYEGSTCKFYKVFNFHKKNKPKI